MRLQWWLSCSQPCLSPTCHSPWGHQLWCGCSSCGFVMFWVMKETALILQHLPDREEPEPPVRGSMGCLSVAPSAPQKLCPRHRAQWRPWVSNAWSPMLGFWILKTWLGWDKLLPVPTESGGSSQTSHLLPFTLVHGAARSIRFPQQMAGPWAKSQPGDLSSSDGLVLGMHETTPPSGVGTDLSSSSVPLLPGPPGYQRIFAPPQIQLTRSRPHPASSIRTSPHGVGQDMAKPEGSKARAKQTRFAGRCHQPSPPSSGAVLLPPKLPECRTCSCAPLPCLGFMSERGSEVQGWATASAPLLCR